MGDSEKGSGGEDCFINGNSILIKGLDFKGKASLPLCLLLWGTTLDQKAALTR